MGTVAWWFFGPFFSITKATKLLSFHSSGAIRKYFRVFLALDPAKSDAGTFCNFFILIYNVLYICVTICIY